METHKRITVSLESSLHRALQLKAAACGCSISEIVTEAVRRDLVEDAIDLAAAEDRAGEPGVDFAVFMKALKRRGRL
jgi:hypothetical protein